MHPARPVMEYAINHGLQEEMRRPLAASEPKYTRQADEIILGLLDIANTDDEWGTAVRLRRARFKRYIDLARPTAVKDEASERSRGFTAFLRRKR